MRLTGLDVVFQSTPPAEAEGDHEAAAIHVPVDGFNPLPPPKRRETRAVSTSSGVSGLFQSTPPAEAEGDAGKSGIYTGWAIWFQSTPPAEAEGDETRNAPGDSGRHCFNPLPPPKRRETSVHGIMAFLL